MAMMREPNVRIRQPRGGKTVLCGVFRAPREDKGEEDRGIRGPLGRWLGGKNPCSASRWSSMRGAAPSRLYEARSAVSTVARGCSGGSAV